MLLESSDDIFAGHLQEWLKPSDFGARLDDSSSSRSSAADGADSERVAGLLQEYLRDHNIYVFIFYCDGLIEIFIVIGICGTEIYSSIAIFIYVL